MDVIDNEKCWRPHYQCEEHRPLRSVEIPGESVGAVEETQIGKYDREALEVDDGVSSIVEAAAEINDGGVDEAGKGGEEELKVSEEGGVVEGPRAGGVKVPEGEREGGGEGEPVAVDFKVGAAIGGDEEELYAGGYASKPGQFFYDSQRWSFCFGFCVCASADESSFSPFFGFFSGFCHGGYV